MKAILLFRYIYPALLFISACDQNYENQSSTDKINVETIPPQVTDLSSLPDSSKPSVIYLNKVPKPQAINITGQPPITLVTQGKGFFTNFTSDDGLPQDVSNSTIVDKNGNLWFGTGAGVSRYDGKNFTTYTTAHGLANNYVTAILEDRSGQFWFGTGGGGVSRFDGKSFTTYTTSHGLPDDIISCICPDKNGNLWFGTSGGGLSRYDGIVFTNFSTEQGLSSNNVTCIIEDRKGVLWIGTEDRGVSCYNGVEFTTVATSKDLGSNSVSSIIEDKIGNFWIGTHGSGVSQYDGQSFTNYNDKMGLVCNDVNILWQDKTGDFWFGTDCGVSHYDGKRFINYNTASGLTGNRIVSIAEDKIGNIWFGSYGTGVSRFDGSSIINYTNTHVLTDYLVFGITKDKRGNLWFGNGEGVSRHDGETISNYTIEHGFFHTAVNNITEDDNGNLWFGTGSGVSCFNGKSFINYSNEQGLPNNYIFKITKDRDGNLWFGTNGGGAGYFDGKSFTTYTKKQGLAGNLVRTITKDRDGNLWFGTGEGVSRYDGKSFTNFTTTQGLAHNFVLNITEDLEGNLWIGTDGGGLSRYDGESFTSFNMTHGLPDNTVTSVVIDSGSNIIIGTNFGIGVMTAFKKKSGSQTDQIIQVQNTLNNEELKSYTPQIEIYNSAAGYPIKDVNWGQNAMFRDSAGIIWIGTGATGLVRFDYAAVHKSNKPPLVILQNIIVNNEKVCWNDILPPLHSEEMTFDSNTSALNITEEATTFGQILSQSDRNSMRIKFRGIKFDSISRFNPVPQNLVLPYKHNSATFEFAAIETARPFLIRYQYMLEGYDTDWSPVMENSSATFGNIHEGKYTFNVKARSPEGMWSDPIAYTFKVLPPLHRTWWAYSLYTMSILYLMYAGFRFQKQRTIRIERQKAFQKQAILNERLRISRDLHDELGSTLSGIVMYSHLAKGQARERKAEAEHSINVVQQSASDMVTKLNDVVWLVNPINDNLEKLIKRLEEYAIQIASAKNMNVVMQHEESLGNIFLPVDTRRSIYMFCKEAINNAVKYSGGTTLQLDVHQESRSLEFRIKDNGTGFDPESIHRGNGLNNMQKRADEIGATMVLESRPDHGTTVSLRCRL